MSKPESFTSFTQELVAEICDRVADGESLGEICKSAGMPDPATVRQWLAENEKFRVAMDLARQHQADAHFESILRIAAEIPEAPSDANATEVSAYRAQLAAASFRVDTLKWVAARLAPKRYSDRVSSSRTSDEESVNLVAQLVAEIRVRNPDALPASESYGPAG